MQVFQDTTSLKVYQFNPDVVVTNTAGVYSFETAAGVALGNLPTTLQPYVMPAPSGPTLAQQAQAMLAAGLSVTSTGTPAISATYATDPVSIQKLIGIELSLAAGQGFPATAATFPLRTVTGTPPQLTPAQYTSVGAKIRDFLALCDLVIDGLSTTLPAATATIA